MTGPEHYKAAEVYLKRAAEEVSEDLCYKLQGVAQVHATLALAAATALGGITLNLPYGSPLAAEWNALLGVDAPEAKP